jgi:anti-anti-sigma factor
MSWWNRLGLRFKIGLGVVLPLALLLLAVRFSVSNYTRDQMQGREYEQAAQLNQLMVTCLESPLLDNRWDEIWATVLNLQQAKCSEAEGEQTSCYEIESVAMFAEKAGPGQDAVAKPTMVLFVTGFPDGRTVQRASLDQELESPSCDVCHRLPPGEREATVLVSVEGQEVLRSVARFENKPACQTCHGTEKSVLGISLMDFRMERFQEAATWLSTRVAIGSGVALLLIILLLFFSLRQMILRPLRELLPSIQAVARGEWGQRVPVRSGDELGQMGTAFNDMTEQLSTAYSELQNALAERQEQAFALQEALDEVRFGQEEQARLLAAIQEMSTPVMPVHEGVLVMPLIGMIDTSRARQVRSALLAAIEQHGAEVVILDITGVPVVDTAVAQALVGTAMAANLLGAESVLVGITPSVAETLVSLGVDLSTLTTRSDLQGGLDYALGRLHARGPGDI